ncbi:MAG: hypothetical protein M1838_000798 [Thelocarpon superellum]|nr:MAG: hypothetical protein M1838_000798 [Thelocarpon superellum]
MDFVHYHAPTYRDSKSDPHCGPGGSDGLDSTNASTRGHPRGEIRLEKMTLSRTSDKMVPEPSSEVDDGDMSSRARLTPEQAALLEREFELHYKPNTGIKRELAEQTGLSLQRVANWFQNRRAKAKQQKRQEEHEALQNLQAAANRQAQAEQSSSNTFFVPPHFPPTEQDRTPRPSVDGQSMGTLAGDPSIGLIDTTFHSTQYGSSTEASYASLSRSLAAAAAAMAEGAYDDSIGQSGDVLLPPDSGIMQSASVTAESMITAHAPTSAFSDWGSSRNSSMVWTPAQQSDADPLDFSSFYTQPRQQTIPEHSEPSNLHEIHANFSNAIDANNLKNPFVIPVFPSQLAHIQQRQQMHAQLPLHSSQVQPQPQAQSQAQAQEPQFCEAPTEEPTSLSQSTFSTSDLSPTTATHDIKTIDLQPPSTSPPAVEGNTGSTNIAARRKRPRPAALGSAALRSHSYLGSFPVSPNAKSSFLGPQPTVRRIKSTGGNLNTLRGRVQKGAPGSAQRSPLNFETFAEAGALNETTTRDASVSDAALSEPLSVSGSLAPPTPLSPSEVASFHQNTPHSAGHGDAGFIYSPDYPGCFVPTTIETQPNLVSPPTTPHYPGLQAYQNNFAVLDYPSSQSNTFLPFDGSLSDEALISPQLSPFPPQIHMPQPVYVSPIRCGDGDLASPLQQDLFYPQPKDMSHDALSTPTFIPEFFYHDQSPTDTSGAVSSVSSTQNQPPPPPPQSKPTPSTQTQPQPKQKNYVFANQTPEDFDS